MLCGLCKSAAALRPWIQLIVYPEVRFGIRVQLAYPWQRSRIAIEDDVFDSRDFAWREVRAVSLGAVVLHYECAKCVRNPGDACLSAAGGLLPQSTRVVRTLA